MGPVQQQSVVLKDVSIETPQVKVRASGVQATLLIVLGFIALLFFIDRKWPHIRKRIFRKKK